MKKPILAASFLLACQASVGASVEPVSTTTTTSANLTPPNTIQTEAAIKEIVSARCNRELACSHIGESGAWGDMNGCVTDVRRVTRDEIVSDKCTFVDQWQLSACVSAIQSATCSSPSASVRSLEDCRRGRLCR